MDRRNDCSKHCTNGHCFKINLKNVNLSFKHSLSPTLCTYLIRPHRHTSHHHWVHTHLPSHLAHVTSSSTGWHPPIHHHCSVLSWIPLLPKLLLPRWSLLPKLLLRVWTDAEEQQEGRRFSTGGIQEKTKKTTSGSTLMSYLLRPMPPCDQPFISAPWYIGPPCGCCCIMGFWGPIRPGIMALGGLPPDGPNEGSPCWPIPTEINHGFSSVRKRIHRDK